MGMDQKQAVRQMIDFQKSSFDNSFNAMVMIQEQAEKMAETFLDQAKWLPDDGKSVLNQWISAYKKGRAEFKKSVDENFQKVDEYFGTSGKEKK
jgi:hypothetical protein